MILTHYRHLDQGKKSGSNVGASLTAENAENPASKQSEEKMGAFIFFIYNVHSDPIFNILPSFRMYWAKYPYFKKWIFKITLFCSWMRFLLGEWMMAMLFSFSYSMFSHCSFQFRDESICHCSYFTMIYSLSISKQDNKFFHLFAWGQIIWKT